MNSCVQKLVSLALNERIFLGEGLFETLRFVNRTPCYSRLHWERLKFSAEFLGLEFLFSFDEWHEQLLSVLNNQPIREGGVKVILTGGIADRGLTKRGKDPQLLFDVFSYTLIDKPLRLISAPWLRDINNPLYSLKSLSYLEAVLGRRYAESKNADDVLFFGHQNQALETTVANLFLCIDKVIYTPALHQGILPGIIRSRIIAACYELGIDICEQVIEPALLSRAHSVFICNALHGIQPVSSWDYITYAENGPLEQQLQRFLVQELGVEL